MSRRIAAIVPETGGAGEGCSQSNQARHLRGAKALAEADLPGCRGTVPMSWLGIVTTVYSLL